MSLRLRFFLLAWPVALAALLFVALGVERAVTVEVDHLERSVGPAGTAPAHADVADSLARRWTDVVRGDAGVYVDRIRATGIELVALDSVANVVLSTDERLSYVGRSSGGGNTMFERRAVAPGGGVAVQAFSMDGLPVVSQSGDRLGTLFIFPSSSPSPRSAVAEVRGNLRRTLWTSVLVASVVSAVAAVLLAGPLVRRLRTLTGAASAIQRGSLDTRVQARGADEIAELEHSFNAMAESLGMAEVHKRNLVTDVAHELRTPLTNIVGSIEAMQDGLLPTDPATLASLRDEAGLLHALVTELQELSLAESGQLRFDMEDVDCVPLVCAAVDAMRGSAGGVLLEGPAAESPVAVRADARRLAQVLRNLLRNAITHTPAGGTVRAEIHDTGDSVRITVTDTGRGIPPEHLPLIWERFHRVDPSRDRTSGGMGLGLALVRQLVLGMGGITGVDSVPGKGTTFYIELRKQAFLAG